MVVDKSGSPVQSSDYYASGMPVAPYGSLKNAEERLHTGKEFNAFSGLAWYDNGARGYDPITMRFLQQDPLAEKYPHLSPYAWCANNPMRFVDLVGKSPTLIPYIVKGAIGAGIDVAAQISTGMAEGKSFMQAVKDMDCTSIGTSFITGVLGAPGMSKAAKIGTAALIATDAVIDVKTQGEVKTAGGVIEEKNK